MLTRRSALKAMLAFPFMGVAHGGVSRPSNHPFLDIFQDFEYDKNLYKDGFEIDPSALSFSHTADGMTRHLAEQTVKLPPRTLRTRRKSDMLTLADEEACNFLAFIFNDFYQSPIRENGIGASLIERVQSYLHEKLTDLYIYEKDLGEHTPEFLSTYNIHPLSYPQYKCLRDAHAARSRDYIAGDILMGVNRTRGIFMRPTASVRIWEPTLAEMEYSFVCTQPNVVCIARYR